MADTYWTGAAANGLLDDNDNWSGSAPGNGDRGFFPASANDATPPSGNMANLVDTIALLQVGKGATYNIGGSGSYLKVMATKVEHFGSGKLWYDMDSNAIADTHSVIIDGPGQADITGTSTATDCDIRCLSGNVTLASGITITNYNLLVGDDAVVTLSAGGSVVDEYEQWGGVVTTGPDITLANIRGGRLNLTGTGTVTKLYVGNATVRWLSETTILYAELMPGGKLDAGGAGVAQTLSESWRHRGSLLIQHDALTLSDDNSYGGDLK